MDTTLSFFCTLGAFLTALIMSWRDVRTRQVLDRELACFAFLTALPRAMERDLLASGAQVPLWAVQTMAFGRSAGGALLLLAVALTARLVTARELLGTGEVLLALAAGFMLPAGTSVPMVSLAFLLALPFSLVQALGRKRPGHLPFIPFLAASAFIIRYLPTSLPSF